MAANAKPSMVGQLTLNTMTVPGANADLAGKQERGETKKRSENERGHQLRKKNTRGRTLRHLPERDNRWGVLGT